MTAAETASKLGYTERAVEGRLYQFRKTAWGLVQSGRIDPSLVRDTRKIGREPSNYGRHHSIDTTPVLDGLGGCDVKGGSA